MPHPHFRDPFATLRLRDYRLYALALWVATMGYQMQSVAIAWELYERTASALVLGGIGLVQTIPVMVLTLPAGQVADQFDRQHLVMGTQVLLALGSLGLAALAHQQGSLGLIYTCLLCSAVARSFYQPANEALLPQLVPLSELGNATTWQSSAMQGATVVGSALGGVAIALQNSTTSVYIMDALLSLTGFGLIAMVSRKRSTYAMVPASLKTLMGGIRFVWQTPIILSAIALDLFAVLVGGAVTLLPIFAKDILQVGAAGLGWMRAAPSMGAVMMAIALAHLPPVQKAGRTLLAAVAGFGIVTILFGLSRSFWLSLLLLALSGALNNISVVIRRTLIQVRTPDALRGRVAAVNSLFLSTSNELGGFESGLVAVLLGPVVAVVAGGLGTIAVVVIVALTSPALRQLESLHPETH